jgi:ribosomal protein S3AE
MQIMFIILKYINNLIKITIKNKIKNKIFTRVKTIYMLRGAAVRQAGATLLAT